jgi:hypothetical protein
MEFRKEEPLSRSLSNQPPTEEEIRGLINENLGPFDVGEAIAQVTALISYDDDPVHEGLLWTNLDPSEQARLEELIDTVFDMSDSLEAQVVDATVRAAMTFAGEYPKARRARLTGLVRSGELRLKPDG